MPNVNYSVQFNASSNSASAVRVASASESVYTTTSVGVFVANGAGSAADEKYINCSVTT